MKEILNKDSVIIKFQNATQAARFESTLQDIIKDKGGSPLCFVHFGA